MTRLPGLGMVANLPVAASLPVAMRYEVVARLACRWPVTSLCMAMGASRSGYHAWRGRRARLALENPRAVTTEALCVAIRECHARSHGTYGSPRVHADLVAQGIRCSRRRIADLMARLALRGCRRNGRRVRTATRSGLARAMPAPDLVRRAFAVGVVPHVDRIWVADTTAIHTGEGWLHLAVVLDLRSRRVVGWSMSDVLDATLTRDALRMALRGRRPQPDQGLVHHSDRGSTSTATVFQAELRAAGISCSMGRPGTCLDNAVAETFFATLKVELVHRHRWPTRAAAIHAIFAYVEAWYNPYRRHRSLGYLSPVAFEAAHAPPASAPSTLDCP